MPLPDPTPRPVEHLVVIGGSAGAMEPLQAVVRGLPLDLPATVCIVLHLPRHSRTALPEILARVCGHDVALATDGELLRPRAIRVAVPDRHLIVDGGRLAVVLGPRENHHRPAVDPLFRTAARALGRHVVSVVLSGALDDGSAGTIAVAMRGGTTIAQDPADAAFPDMPANAIATGHVRHVVPADRVADVIVDAIAAARTGSSVSEPAKAPRTEAASMGTEESYGAPPPLDGDPRGATSQEEDFDPAGNPSPYSCPACGGVLWVVPSAVDQFRCRVGHRFTHEALDGEQDAVIEEALWTALRALEEQASLSDRVADRATSRGDEHAARRFAERRDDALRRARQIRSVLERVLGAANVPASPQVARLGEPVDA